MCNCKHKCFITVSAFTSSGSFTLPNSERINKGRVTSVMLRRSGASTLKNAAGATLATDAVIGTAHIAFKNSNGEEVTSPLPLSTLQRDYNNPDPLPVNWQGIDLGQTVITLDASAVTASHVVEIIFGLECDNADKCGK